MEKINERYNIATKPTETWDRFVDLITEYLYDANGIYRDAELLMAEPEIPMSVFKQFYMSIHNTFRFPDDIIPSWIGKFWLYINKEDSEDAQYSGCVKGNDFSYDEDNDKLSFTIYLTYDWGNPTLMKSISSTLAHEFRHAYSIWFYYKYGFQRMTEAEEYAYNKWLPILRQTPVDKRPDNMYYQLASLFYIANSEEMRAGMEEYKKDADMTILENMDEIKEEMKKVKNLQDIYSVRYSHMSKYALYQRKLDMVNKLKKDLYDRTLPVESLTEMLQDDVRDMINAFLFTDEKRKEESNKIIDWNINLIYQTMDDEDNEYIHEKHLSLYDTCAKMILKILKIFKPRLEKELADMKSLFYEELYKLVDEAKQKEMKIK